MKVMIVDDQAPIRSMLRDCLLNAGADVVECASGEEALARYASESPDWVTLDFRMPTLDGIATAELLKRMDPQARLVMVTQWDDPVLRDAARRTGVSAYVLKDDASGLLKALGLDPFSHSPR